MMEEARRMTYKEAIAIRAEAEALLAIYRYEKLTGDTQRFSTFRKPSPAIPDHPWGPFDMFWEGYPRKNRRAEAQEAWDAIEVDLQLFCEILAALEESVNSPAWQRDEGKFIPHAHRWLLDWAAKKQDPNLNKRITPIITRTGGRWVPA